MGLYRKNPAPQRVRRRVACWTSLGVAVGFFFLAAVTSLSAWQSHLRLDISVSDSSTDSPAHPRRLCTALETKEREEEEDTMDFIDDPLISKPYGCSDQKPLVFFHIVIIAYMLLGLNTVCDLYFTGALDEMVMKWKIQPDVAGATFMAAGGSAPELFTSLIGATVSRSDIGFGTIVGSAVFNVLFVIGLCGFAAKEPIKLTWWPLFRDCSYYIIGLCALAGCAKTGPNKISLGEAILLFCGYIGYCTIMYNNPKLEKRFVKKGQPEVTPRELTPVTPVEVVSTGPIADTGGSGDKHHIKKSQPHFERRSGNYNDSKLRTSFSSKDLGSHSSGDVDDDDKKADTYPSTGGPADVQVNTSEGDRTPGVSEDEEEEDDDIEDLLLRPEGTVPFILWCLSLPIYVMLYYGIPKPNQQFFMFTFTISLIFIAGFSFVLVFCVEVLGAVLQIPVIVMSFTLLAAGTSIPDLVSSMAVARAGEGDMAVSSSIGSNIFDILVGLPIPWIIKIAFVDGNSSATVNIKSDFIVFYVIILVFMVFAVICCIHYLGWFLNKALGVGMALLYALFLTIVLTVELTEKASPGSCNFLKI